MPSFKVNPVYAAISEVVPGLFISGVSALNQRTMEKFQIVLVINATNEVPNLKCLGPDVHRVKLWLDDLETEDIYRHFDTVADQIDMVNFSLFRCSQWLRNIAKLQIFLRLLYVSWLLKGLVIITGKFLHFIPEI